MKIKVMQGIGDIMWVHQKLFNYVDEFEYVVQVIPNDISVKLQTRGVNFIKTWPKVKSVNIELTTDEEYTRQATGIWRSPDFLDGTIDHFSLNKWLETGNKLEDLDDNTVKWKIELPTKEMSVDNKFCCLYVSGNNFVKEECWKLTRWANLLGKVDMPIYLLGASYDIKCLKGLYEILFENMNKPVRIYMDHPPEEVAYLLKECEFFIGYQSGLNIMCEQFNTPQLMVYLNWVYPMKDAWVSPDNRNDTFQNISFAHGPINARKIVEKHFLE